MMVQENKLISSKEAYDKTTDKYNRLYEMAMVYVRASIAGAILDAITRGEYRVDYTIPRDHTQFVQDDIPIELESLGYDLYAYTDSDGLMVLRIDWNEEE